MGRIVVSYTVESESTLTRRKCISFAKADEES
jgi:hypothetical protein